MELTRIARNAFLPLMLALLVAGCGARNSAILSPAGPIADHQRDLIVRTSGIMLVVVIPVIIMTLWFAWRYRESSKTASYRPEWAYSLKVDAVVWAIPIVIVAGVGYHAWVFSHSLDPYKPIPSAEKTVEVRAIAQDWKWLFLYPEHNIAVVNELVFPSGAPLRIQITSDTVMNSFFIPGLGGQIYAMAGMRTELNLLSYEPGEFLGRNIQYSGDGFSDQRFNARALERQDFDAWVETVRQSVDALDACAYKRLAQPSANHPVTYFSTYLPDLFAETIAKYDPRSSSRQVAECRVAGLN